MSINREDFLRALVWAQPGIATREFIEQSSCVVLKDGQLITFNDEISCQVSSGLDSKILGVVPHKALLTILQKLTDESLSVTQEDGELLFQGVRDVTAVRLEKQILLPYDSTVDKPKKWSKIPPEFSQAAGIVSRCVTGDESQEELTCVHIHPERLEATDLFHAARYYLEIPVRESLLVRGDSLKHVASFGAVEISESAAWLHFRGPGVMHSYRKYAQAYKDIDSFFEVEGQRFVFPKALDKSVENAEVFSGESADENMIEVTLKKGRVTIKGLGVQGWYQGRKECAYDGPPITFGIPPKILKELSTKHNECIVGTTKILVKGDGWKYIAGLKATRKS